MERNYALHPGSLLCNILKVWSILITEAEAKLQCSDFNILIILNLENELLGKEMYQAEKKSVWICLKP